MLSNLDIFRSANTLVKRYGNDAPIHAAMLDKGELDGYAVWKRVLRAVEELQRAELTEGERAKQERDVSMSKTPDGGVNIEVPVARMKITGHPPTVRVSGTFGPRRLPTGNFQKSEIFFGPAESCDLRQISLPAALYSMTHFRDESTARR